MKKWYSVIEDFPMERKVFRKGKEIFLTAKQARTLLIQKKIKLIPVGESVVELKKKEDDKLIKKNKVAAERESKKKELNKQKSE